MAVRRDEAETWASWFRALGDPSRILILNLLATTGRPMSVGEIVSELDLAQSTVSHHLKILGEVGFALVDRQVTSSWWRVNEQCLACFPSAAEVVMGRLPQGMTPSQFAVLNHLGRLGGEWTPVRLANAMQVTKGAMTNTLGHLTGKGFVSIRPDDRDGRAKLVSITTGGREARDRTIMALAPELEELVEGVSPELIAEITPKLEAVRRFLDRRRG